MDIAESNVGLDIRRKFLICSRFPDCDGKRDRITPKPTQINPDDRSGILIEQTARRSSPRNEISHHVKLSLMIGIGLLIATFLIVLTKENDESTVDKDGDLATLDIDEDKMSKQVTPFQTLLPSPNPVAVLPQQPSAICRDGTYSYSRNRRGTCSHHGGVATWVTSAIIAVTDTANPASATVTRVIDGDTIDVRLSEGTQDTIRFIGVDTPETSSSNKQLEYGDITDTDCLDEWGDNATEYTETYLSIGSSVVLQFDGKQERDFYGRLLAYIHLPSGVDFNNELVKNGLARVYEEGDSARESEYLKSQVSAIKAGVGLWQCSSG